MKKINKKSIMAMAVTTVLTLSQTVFAEFVDMPSNPAENTALTNAVTNGLLSGTSDTTIEPYSGITRAEMGTIIVRCFGATETADLSSFKDMKSSEWYYDYMAKAVKMGAFTGSGDGTLSPEAGITRQEAFIVMSRLFDIQDNGSDALNSNTVVDDWARTYVEKIVTNGYWSNEAFDATAYMTRVEFAILMDNMVKTYITVSGEYDNLPNGNVMVKASDVKITNTTNTGDVMISDVLGTEGTVEFNNCELNRVIMRSGKVSVPDTKINDVRMTVSGAEIFTSGMKDIHSTKIWGAKGTTVNLGDIGGDR